MEETRSYPEQNLLTKFCGSFRTQLPELRENKLLFCFDFVFHLSALFWQLSGRETSLHWADFADIPLIVLSRFHCKSFVYYVVHLFWHDSHCLLLCSKDMICVPITCQENLLNFLDSNDLLWRDSCKQQETPIYFFLCKYWSFPSCYSLTCRLKCLAPQWGIQVYLPFLLTQKKQHWT